MERYCPRSQFSVFSYQFSVKTGLRTLSIKETSMRLTYQAVALVTREASGEPIKIERQSVSLLPNQELLEILYCALQKN